MKKCIQCGKVKEDFLPTKSAFFDGTSSICNSCLENYLGNCEDFTKASKLCQWLDVSFDPNNWIALLKANGPKTYLAYFQLYSSRQDTSVDWTAVNAIWSKYSENAQMSKNIHINNELELQSLKNTWGENWTASQLKYLERFYDDMERTQNINTAIQRDNARKMAKLSLQLDEMIEKNDKGADIKSIVAASDQLAKAADFTTKSAKNIGDFDSVGELFKWLEKKGWQNPHYDWKDRDDVDMVMNNLQRYTKRIVLGESNIAADLENKIKSLSNDEAKLDLEEDLYEAIDMSDLDESLQDELSAEFEI